MEWLERTDRLKRGNSGGLEKLHEFGNGTVQQIWESINENEEDVRR
jgi:hypothetical protein